MNIAFLTADEPLYLPAFFARLLAGLSQDTVYVFTVPSRYGRDSSWRMTIKYTRACGVWNLGQLGWRTLRARLFDLLKIGRSHGRFCSVRSAAAVHNVPCEQIAGVNDAAFLQRLRDMKVDLVVSVSCPQIFRKALIDLPPLGCLNVHGAPLPKYRGIAPSFWMMAHGETRAAVTVHFMAEQLDRGDAIEVQAFDILPDETLDQFITRSKGIACQALLRAIEKVRQGDPGRTPLSVEESSYFGFPTRQAYREFRRRGRRLW